MDKRYFKILEDCGATITPLNSDNRRARLDIYDAYGIGIKMDVYASASGARAALKRWCGKIPFVEVSKEEFGGMFVEKTGGYPTMFPHRLYENKTISVQMFSISVGETVYDVEIDEGVESRCGEDILMYNAWLSRKNCCIKKYIIGSPAYQHPTKADFISMIAWSIDVDIRLYEDEVARLEEL